LGHEVFTVMLLATEVVWVVVLCRRVNGFRRFESTATLQNVCIRWPNDTASHLPGRHHSVL